MLYMFQVCDKLQNNAVQTNLMYFISWKYEILLNFRQKMIAAMPAQHFCEQ